VPQIGDGLLGNVKRLPSRGARVFADSAIGGATAVLFYAEPTRTYDLDVLVKILTSPTG